MQLNDLNGKTTVKIAGEEVSVNASDSIKDTFIVIPKKNSGKREIPGFAQ